MTGSDRGVGLGLVTRFLEKGDPPEWIFATSLDLEGFHGKVRFLQQDAVGSGGIAVRQKVSVSVRPVISIQFTQNFSQSIFKRPLTYLD